MARERLAIEDGCGRIAPRSSWRPRPLIEIGNENSLRRELSAGYSEGKPVRDGCSDGQSLGGRRRRQRVPLGPCAGRFGRELLSRKVQNDEADISRLIEEALSFAEEVLWAVDQPGGGAALLLALLWERNQRVLYVPGLSVDRARDVYRRESKIYARDAYVIAEQARMRSDLSQLRLDEQEIAELQLLLTPRRDLVTDQSKIVTASERRLCLCFRLLSGH